MTEKRVHLVVTGQVQGVSFRAYTVRTARGLGLTGWVRNLPTGEVEIMAEGTRSAVELLIQWARTGPSLARVENLDVSYEEPTGAFTDFEVQ